MGHISNPNKNLGVLKGSTYFIPQNMFLQKMPSLLVGDGFCFYSLEEQNQNKEEKHG